MMISLAAWIIRIILKRYSVVVKFIIWIFKRSFRSLVMSLHLKSVSWMLLLIHVVLEPLVISKISLNSCMLGWNIAWILSAAFALLLLEFLFQRRVNWKVSCIYCILRKQFWSLFNMWRWNMNFIIKNCWKFFPFWKLRLLLLKLISDSLDLRFSIFKRILPSDEFW